MIHDPWPHPHPLSFIIIFLWSLSSLVLALAVLAVTEVLVSTTLEQCLHNFGMALFAGLRSAEDVGLGGWLLKYSAEF